MSGSAGTRPTARELETLCVELAGGAAQVVREARGGGLAVTSKSTTTDLVTDVDRTTERWLRAEIARRRPGDAILGEEDGDQLGTTGVRWVVDPIDGTVNFVLGIPLYAVSVAAEVDGSVVAGAVANPVSGELFRAHVGGGAYLDGERLIGPRDVALEQAVIVTGFAYDSAMRRRQMAVAAPLLPRIADLRRLGSAALDLCFVAAGRCDASYEAGLNPWDYAAGALIATEAGCVVGDLRGGPPTTRMCAAAGPGLAPQLWTLLDSLGADGVSR